MKVMFIIESASFHNLFTYVYISTRLAVRKSIYAYIRRGMRGKLSSYDAELAEFLSMQHMAMLIDVGVTSDENIRSFGCQHLDACKFTK